MVIPPLSLRLLFINKGGGSDWTGGVACGGVFSNEPPTYCTDCTLQRGRFLTFTALPLVFRRRPEGDASAQRSPRLSRIPPPPLMGAPYKESLEVSYRILASLRIAKSSHVSSTASLFAAPVIVYCLL